MNIKELAEQAGLVLDGEHWFSAIQQADVRNIDLERFAELIRADQREIDAKLCEEFIGEDQYDMFGNDLAEQCSTAIRQRGEK